MSPDAWVTLEHLPAGAWEMWRAAEGDRRCGIRADGTAACATRDGEPARSGLPTGPATAWRLAYGAGCGLGPEQKVRCGPIEPAGKLAFRPPTDPLVAFDLTELGRDLCGVRPDGTLVCARSERSRLPEPPPGAFRDVSCGADSCCALPADGAPRCWGAPALAEAPPGPFSDLAVDDGVACGVASDGSLGCWGPGPLPRGATGPFVSVDHGIVARRADGTAVLLHGSFYGRLAYELPPVRWAGSGFATDPEGRPFAYLGTALGPVPQGRFVDVDAGTDAVCAVSAEGRVRCFGGDAWVVAGAPTDAGFVEVSVGPWNACARRADGATACWGRPPKPEDEAAVRGPSSALPPIGVPVAALLPGTGTCGVPEGGGVVCRDGAGLVTLPGVTVAAGRRSDLCVGTPTGLRCGWVRTLAEGGGDPVPGEALGLALGYAHACARTAEGARCWGRDTSGETQPPPGPFRLLALGEKRSCGLRPDGRAECWGGSAAPPPTDRFVDLAMTQETDLRMPTFVCGVRDDGALRCWSYGPPG